MENFILNIFILIYFNFNLKYINSYKKIYLKNEYFKSI